MKKWTCYSEEEIEQLKPLILDLWHWFDEFIDWLLANIFEPLFEVLQDIPIQELLEEYDKTKPDK